jgi:hypothetical protein
MIAQGNWGGELAILEDDTSRSIFFDGGNVVSATTNVANERLGEILWRFGAITRDQHDQLVRETEKTGKRIGDTAMDLEFVEADELFRMMARQVEEVFYGAVHVASATFFLFDRFDDRSLTRRHHLSTSQLLMEAARRMDELRFFREKVPSDAWVPTPLPSAAGKRVPSDLADLFAQCDGRRSVAEIGRRIGQLEFEVTRAVFQLVTAGLVMVVAPKAEGPAAIVETVNGALAEMHAACDAVGSGADLRAGIERFASSTGVFGPLLAGAGPLPDGTLQPDRVAKNAAAVAGQESEGWLGQQLFEYAGFALFHAGSLLSREAESALNLRTAEMLKPLRQQLEGNTPAAWHPSAQGSQPAAAKGAG